MNGGSNDPEKGVLCASMTDCKPTVMLQFEKLFSNDNLISEAEFDRMSQGMERPGLPIIEQEARHCVIRQTKGKKKWANQWDDRSRLGKGDNDEDKLGCQTLTDAGISPIER